MKRISATLILAAGLLAASSGAQAASCDTSMLRALWTGYSDLAGQFSHCTISMDEDGAITKGLCTGVILFPVTIVTGRLVVKRNCDVVGRMSFDMPLGPTRRVKLAGTLDDKRGHLDLRGEKRGVVRLGRFLGADELP